MLEKPINLLITGGGAPGAYGIIKALLSVDKNINITAADMKAECIGKIIAPDFVQIPPANASHFIDEVLAICKEKSIDVILPLVTRELELFSRAKDLFESAGTKILVADYDLLRVVNNKGELYSQLERKGVSVPKFGIASNVDEFVKISKDLNYPKEIICFKPCNSNGKRGFRILDTKKDKFELWLNQKPDNSYINWNDSLNILTNRDCPSILVSEYMPGKEYTVDVFRSKGKTHYIIPRLRSKMIGGISVEGTIENNQKIINYCKEIIEVFPIEGLFGIQVKLTENKEPLILEINPRVQGTTVACIGAGVNLSLLFVRDAIDSKEEIKFPDVQWDTKFIRHWEEKFL